MRVFAPTITSFMHVILSSKIRRTCYFICTTIAPIMILASYNYLRDFSHIKTRHNCYLCLLAVSRIKKYMSGYTQPKVRKYCRQEFFLLFLCSLSILSIIGCCQRDVSTTRWTYKAPCRTLFLVVIAYIL